MWTAADTVETVAAVAEALVAAGTGVLALKTHGLAAQTENMAAETKRVADATENLVREAQLDRELYWSPFLLRADRLETVDNPAGNVRYPQGYSEKIRVANVGKGQALDCVYVSRKPTDVSRWCYAGLPALAGGESTEVVQAGPDGLSVQISTSRTDRR